jgi:hypothetical protein
VAIGAGPKPRRETIWNPRRWEEKESVPVHRFHHGKRGSVSADHWELDA